MKDKIIEDFEKLIDDICGENINIKIKYRQEDFDKLRNDLLYYKKFYIMNGYYNSIVKEREVRGRHYKEIIKCSKCGCKQEIYYKHSYPAQTQDYYLDEYPNTVNIRSYDFFCPKCGSMYRTTGKIIDIKVRFEEEEDNRTWH